MARVVVIAIAAVTLAVVGVLVWGASRGDDGTAVGDLPSVGEVVAAQAHRHGVDLPELTDADRARLSAPPTAGSSLSPYDQVLLQLIAVRDSAGIDEAVTILGEVTLQSDAVATECRRLYDELTAQAPSSLAVNLVCPTG